MNDDDADLLDLDRLLRSSEVAWRDVVVVPEIEIDHVTARQQRPRLWRENPKVCPGIRRGLRTRVTGEHMQDPEFERAILVHLREHTGRGVHERSESPVCPGNTPDPGVGVRVG